MLISTKIACYFVYSRSRKCLDSNGKVTIFAVKKGSDQSFLWKATVRIACVKCDPESNRIENYKLINLREFLKVFNTFQTHLEAMSSCEEQHDRVSLSLFLLGSGLIFAWARINPYCKETSIFSGNLSLSLKKTVNMYVKTRLFFPLAGTAPTKFTHQCRRGEPR